jgi:mono/diheme cytochrome c family protein|tara:strand:- start:797 stop:1642 length:846 start_codon:yes stop_codon:yes gene_type:complete
LFGAALLTLMAFGWWFFAIPDVSDVAIPQADESIERGHYLVDAAGCVSCHEGIEHPGTLSGGLALTTEFGTFFVSNITPDETTGIGGWNGRDFLLALKHGRSREGDYYFPVFPYRAYAGMTDEDVLDVAAYLMSLPSVKSAVPDHETSFWLQRWMIAGWNRLASALQPDFSVESDPKIERGSYLARSLGHCGECHTPRNIFGIPDLRREFAGARLGEGDVEAIDEQALSQWTQEDFVYLLFLGVKPDGEFVGGEMEKVIEHNTGRLTQEDREALAAFFKRD